MMWKGIRSRELPIVKKPSPKKILILALVVLLRLINNGKFPGIISTSRKHLRAPSLMGILTDFDAVTRPPPPTQLLSVNY